MLDILKKRVAELKAEVEKSMQMHNALFGRMLEAQNLLSLAEQAAAAISPQAAAAVEVVKTVVDDVEAVEKRAEEIKKMSSEDATVAPASEHAAC